MSFFKKSVDNLVHTKIVESLSEGLKHDRYMRSHSKKASNVVSTWAFTTKKDGTPSDEEMVMISGKKLADAAKEAMEKLKAKTVYVMEDGGDFAYAAARAKEDGKKEFKFAGKTWPVTIKTDIPEESDIDEVLDTPKAMKSYRDKAKASKEKAASSAVAKMNKSMEKGHRAHPAGELKTIAKRAAGERMANKRVREEVELDEDTKTHFVYQRNVPKTKQVVHRGTEQSSKEWIQNNAKHFIHKGKDFDIYKGKISNVKPSDRVDFEYVAEEVNLDEAEFANIKQHQKAAEYHASQAAAAKKAGNKKGASAHEKAADINKEVVIYFQKHGTKRTSDLHRDLKAVRNRDAALKATRQANDIYMDEATDDFGKKFGKRIGALMKGGKGAEYLKKKADQARQQNKDLDPGAAKKGLGIGVIDKDKANKKRMAREQVELEEIAPVLGVVGGAIARGVGGAIARGVGRTVARGVGGAIARGVGGAIGAGVGSAVGGAISAAAKKDKDEANKKRMAREDLDEVKMTDAKNKEMMRKALGVSKLGPKHANFTTAFANNGDFVVHDGGGRVVGRITKADLNEAREPSIEKISAILNPTKNSEQGIQALMKSLKVDRKTAEMYMDKAMDSEMSKTRKEEADPDTVAMIKDNPKMRDKILRGLDAKSRKEIEAALNESHFSVGDKVRCIRSGMTGVVTKADPEEKGKYYTVKRDDGSIMKYAPDELEAVMSEAIENAINYITAEYINENNISLEQLENMTESELNELIGKAIGAAFRGAKAVAKRFSTAGRADAAEKRAAAAEKKNKDRERIKAAKERLKRAKAATRSEAIETDTGNKLTQIGQLMMKAAETEKNDMIANAYSRLGDLLTQYGTPFGPRNMKELEQKSGLKAAIIKDLMMRVQKQK